MKTTILTFAFSSIFFLASSQKILNEYEIKLNSTHELIPIVDEETKQLTTVHISSDFIYALAYDSLYQVLSTLKLPRPYVALRNIAGYGLNNGSIFIYLTNKKSSKFASLSFKMDSKNVSYKMYDAVFKSEKHVGSISYKNKFYVLSQVGHSSNLNLREFNDKDFEKIFLNFEASEGGQKISNVFSNVHYSDYKNNMRIVDVESNNSLAVASGFNKIFYYDDQIFFTMDRYSSKTYLLSVNLENYDVSSNVFSHGKLTNSESSYSNSFLYGDYISQVRASDSELYACIKRLDDQKIVKEFRVSKSESINFKNSDFKQEGGNSLYSSGTNKALKDTKAFLKKMTSGSAAISMYELEGSVMMTIGGYRETRQGSAGFGTGGVSISIGFSTPSMSAYPTTFNGLYPSMNSISRVSYFSSLLDTTDFSHQNGKINNTAFDKIDAFSRTMSEKFRLTKKTIFKVNNYYILGYYYPAKKKYCIRKFSDTNLKLN